MKVSIVTPCYNSESTIEDTIRSVLYQTYPKIEHIIMDGGSTDATVAIVRRYEPRVVVCSEPDRGQSDAINKGWKRASGDILVWLNGDDRYFPDTVEQAVRYFREHPEVMWVYGQIENIDLDGKPVPIRPINQTWDYQKLLDTGNFVAQPTAFIRRQVVEEFGYLCESLHYGMDHEYWLRIGRRYPGYFVPEIRARMIRFRAAKTETGGTARIQEIRQIVTSYGGVDLPWTMHVQWVQAFMISGIYHLLHGRWQEGHADITRMLRYPSLLPRAIVKTILGRMLSYRMEGLLRRRLLGKS